MYILNFNDKTVTWDNDTILMKDTCNLNTQNARVDVNLAEIITNMVQRLTLIVNLLG
jgi:hypothetical protein